MKSDYNLNSDPLRILVMGYLIRGPIAGMTWHHVQYLLGLQSLGHQISYYEDSGDTLYSCYNPETSITDQNPVYGLNYLTRLFDKLKLNIKWAYYDANLSKWHGKNSEEFSNNQIDFDLLINLSASNPIRDWMQHVPIRALIDTDPLFTQIRNLQDPTRNTLTLSHNKLFSFGENIHLSNCNIPDDGFHWLPTRQPIVLDLWENFYSIKEERFTSIMQWKSYASLEYKGVKYGLKSDSFSCIEKIPLKSHCKFEMALGGEDVPRKGLREKNWILINPLEVSKNPWNYQKYIQHSKGELSVAKHGYVVSNSGWFSERSACYLASGRPVITQETGFSNWMETGTGVMGFKDEKQALDALEMVNSNYKSHCQKALELAHEYFDAKKILKQLINSCIYP